MTKPKMSPELERFLAEIELKGRKLPVTMHPIEQREGNQLVNISPEAFDKAFQNNDWQYVGKEGQGGIEGRYQRFGDFVKEAPSMRASNVAVDKNGSVVFGDGRHRYAYLRDQGLGSIPMSMDKESIEHAQKHGYIHKADGGPVEHFKKGGEKKALPLQLPRAQALTTQQMQEIVDRIARQQTGEHVTSGEPGDTKNLAGRSMAEAKRVQGLQYGLTPTGTVTPGAGYQMRKGDINVGLPGDTTISNQILEHINGLPIGSEQQGGPRYGHGHLHKDEPFFWASGEQPAQNFQNKVDELARMTGQEPRVIAHHLAMGRVANNFAQHLADANMRAIHNAMPAKTGLKELDKVIAGGYLRKNPNTGEKEHVTFPEFAGVASGPEALEQMKRNPELRKWFNNRMKSINLTKELGLPSGLDTEWAVTEPALRNLEVSMTGHSVGRMMPGKPLIPGAEHETYSHGIQGRALSAAPELAPVEVAFPDATNYIRQHYRPADFTGTIQKVYPHQIVDEQHLQEMAKYYDMLRKTRGFADGGDVKQPSIDEMQAALAMRKPAHLAMGGQAPKNWVRKDAAYSPEHMLQDLHYTTAGGGNMNDALAQMESHYTPEAIAALEPDMQEFIHHSFKVHRNKAAVNNWVDSVLKNYVKKQMATPNDPIRKLAEEGITHLPHEEVPVDWSKHREDNGGGEMLGKTRAAQAWESLTDPAIQVNKAKDLKDFKVYDPFSGTREAPQHQENKNLHEPWMEKTDPETPVHSLIPSFFQWKDHLGFKHIRDVLHEDLQEGRIRPEQLSKVGIEQAVRRTHEYNEQKKKAMLEAKLKQEAEQKVHKDYGNGYRWIELALDKNLPEGWSQHPSGTYTDPEGYNHVQHPNYDKLEEALKYEGETMGHCVGGYCPDVASGESRIFSLRDAKNEPHITIETQPRKVRTWNDVTAAVGPDEAAKLWREFDSVGGNNTSNTEHAFDTFVKQKGIKAPDRIEQIKGKGNAKPASKYIPYAQDFVKSGKWSEINDYGNTDLFRVAKNQHATKEELESLGRHHYPEHNMPAENVLMHYDRMRGMPEYQNEQTKNFIDDLESGNYRTSPVQQKARGGIVHKATGGSMPSLGQMQAELMMKRPASLTSIMNVGAEEAPSLPIKDFILPHGQHPGQLPVGGIDMQPAVPGVQLWPTQPPAPGQQPQQGQQQPQQGAQPSQGGPQGQPPSNILQMTPQGQAMNAMTPPQGPQAMADGGGVDHYASKGSVTKRQQTVKNAQRMAYPGIYGRPDEIAALAASRVAPEDPILKQLFGVNRAEMFEQAHGRQGMPHLGVLPGASANPRGAEAAENVMNPRNERRLLDVLGEAQKHEDLRHGMEPWYYMDPLFQHMVKLLGPEKAAQEYKKMNALMGMASSASEVNAEIPRGSLAYYLQNQGRFNEFVQHGGKRDPDRPADFGEVPGHLAHKTAHAVPMKNFLTHGEVSMSSPKVPMYIEASGVPEIGFQTRTPVGDAHWSRAVGLADTRNPQILKGQEVVPGASVTNPEMSLLGPWWQHNIANKVGLESVPAQALAWGAFSPQTGVTTPIGAPKLELIAKQIGLTAKRLGVSPETARDLVLTGKERMGKKKGGTIKPIGKGFTKEKVTVSPNLDAMQYELMSVKHFKKAK